MAVFSYQGRGSTGVMTGEIEAADRTSAVGELRRRAILVTKINEKAGGKTPAKAGRKVKDKEMAIFTRQFSTMIDAGLPLVQCLTILSEQSESKNLREVTGRVARSVEQGSTLADALRRHPRTFDDLFTNLVEVGETGGILDTVFQRLAAYIEKAAALKRKVKSAMIYPASIIGVAFLVVVFMLTFVIPTFTKMFRDLGADLPLPTQVVVWLSDFVRSYILLIAAGVVGCVFALRAYYRTEKGRSTIDALMLKLPVVGTLIRKVAVARFTRTLGTLVSSGVPILEGLRRVPAHGHPDDLGRRADGRSRRHALEDRRLLRRRGGHCGGRAHRAPRAHHDRGPRRDHRRSRSRHVPADLQAGDPGQVAAAVEDRQLLRATLRELGWARLLAATLVLVAGVLLRFADAFPADFPPFVVTVTTAALVACLLLLGTARSTELRGFAWMQICLDVALVTGIIAASGGSRSVFTFLYILTVLEGSFLLARPGGLVAAGLAALLYTNVVLGRHLLAFLHLCVSVCCFFNDTATALIYTLSLHDALPI